LVNKNNLQEFSKIISDKLKTYKSGLIWDEMEQSIQYCKGTN